MTRAYQWFYNGSAISGATSKTYTLTTGQDDSDLIECRTSASYGSGGVSANGPWVATQEVGTQLLSAGSYGDSGRQIVDDNVPWSLFNGLTASNNTWNSPLGGTLGDTLTQDATTGGEARNEFFFSTSTTYNFSAYFGKTKNQWVRLRLDGISQYFDVNNGVAGSALGGTTSNVAITDEGNAYRCSFEITTGGTISSNEARVYMASDDASTSATNTSIDVDGILLTQGTGLKAYPV